MRGARVAVGLVALLWTSAGRAEGLVYQRGPGAESCPDADAFRHEVAILAQVDETAVAAVAARVRLSGEAGVFHATILRGDGEPVIEHRAADCPALLREVALTVSLFLPDAPAPGPAPSSSTPPPSSPPFPPACVGACLEKVRQEAREQMRHQTPVVIVWPVDLSILVTAGGLMTAGWAADVSPGFWLGGEVRGEWLSFAVEARVLLPAKVLAREPITSPSSARELDVSQFSGVLVPCVKWNYLLGCAAVLLGGQYQKSRLAEATIFDFELGPRVAVEVPIGNVFAIRGIAEALFVPSQGGADFGPPGNVRWTQSIVAGFFGIGASARFP